MDQEASGLEPPKDIEGKVQLTGEQVIRKLRLIVAPPGKRPGWLNQLNDKQLAEVFHRLKIGQAAYKIAKICKEEWGYMKKSDLKSLSRAVRAFKNEALGDLELELVAHGKERKEVAKNLSRRAERIVKDLDGLGRMRWLIEVMTDRVQILLEREKKALPFQFTDKTLELLATTIEKYMRLQIDMGILDSVPSEVNLNIKGRFDGLMQHTVEGGQAVISAADKWLEACEQAALTLKLDDNGKYQLVQGEVYDACSSESNTA